MALRQRILLLGAFAIAAMTVALWLQYRSHGAHVLAVEAVKRNVGAVGALSAAVHELQKERGLTAIAGRGSESGALLEQIRSTDAALARLAAAGVDFSEPQTALAHVRSAVAADAAAPQWVRGAYTALLRKLIDDMDRLTREPEAGVAKADIAAHAHLVAAKEHLGQIRAALGEWLEHGGDAGSALEQVIRLKGIHEEELRKFAVQGAPELQELLAARSASHEVQKMQHALAQALVSGNPRPALRAGEWFALATACVDGLKAVEDESLRLIEGKAERDLVEVRRSMRVGLVAALISGAVVLVLTISTTVFLLRRIERALAGIERMSSSRDFSTRIPTDAPDEIGRISGSFNKLLDVVETLLSEKEYLANTDPLTGICNRLRFGQALHEEAERKRRNNTPMALVMLDIDHFKRINDSFGHNAGDEVLRHLANVVNQNIRTSDFFARWGGEEFVLLLRDDDCARAMIFAEKIRNVISATRFPAVGKITCSFGVAAWKPGDTEADFIARADKGLYESKRQGRDRVCCAIAGSFDCSKPAACAA